MSGNLAIIPARSGSKGLPDKNIRLLGGIPLIAHSIEAALESGIFDNVVVSTDSEEYGAIARKFGASVPFLRPDELATDASIAYDTYVHVVDKLARDFGQEFDKLFVLQPTSPLRRPRHIRQALSMFENPDVDAVVSVTELEHPASWINILPPDKNMGSFLTDSAAKSNRQDHETYYRLNGALYASTLESFRRNQGFYGPETHALVMERRYSVDIDDELDFVVAETLFEREQVI